MWLLSSIRVFNWPSGQLNSVATGCPDGALGRIFARMMELFVQEDGTEYLYRREVYRTDENVEYSTRGLVGPNRVSRIQLTEDVVRRGPLQGSVHLRVTITRCAALRNL